MSTASDNKAIELFKSQAELEKAALDISNQAPENLRQATYLYFLARFLVIYYEVNFAELPVQVWNEYRNALDHYFRSITESDANEAIKHQAKMEGHLQRAVLDICKIICHKTESRFVQTLSSENQEALRLVNNGDFYPQLHEKFKCAKNAFVGAKAFDLRLGDGAVKDRGIIGEYLQAFYCYRDAELFLEDNRDKIHIAEQLVKALQHQSSKHHIRDSLIAKFIWYVILIGGGGILINIIIKTPWWADLKTYLTSIFLA